MNERNIENGIPSIEIVAIGTELVMGRVLDTNTHWIEGQVVNLGGRVRRAVAVEDDPAEILDVLRDAVRRKTDVVVTTGGLGPTPDDVTSECLAQLAGTTVEPHGATLDDFVLRRDMKSRDELTPNLLRMATVPLGATIHANAVGWAPCIDLQVDGTRVFALAGPPKETEGVFTAHVAPVVAELSSVFRLAERVTVDLWESELSPYIEEVMRHFPGSYLKGYVAMRAEERLPVDVIVSDVDHERAQVTLEQAMTMFTDLLGEQGKTVERS
jgi:nicotinamide-nucleotide amidase